ncbi:putative major facilitator superfamily protein [Frondihabitans sucicola]|uniref:Major facilitator superfamily protein n=1 Tax=Frondihabitans sucicola TaxID=1268041 RepID=A0ABN6XYL0_9MICO|nr:MFS transporter [Frondihabitans sucicola]BDZ48740.1 putative major facilitator superfamily protein [Frondihabitans sucicola]
MTTLATTETTPALAWRMLVLGVLAQASGTVLVSTPAFLIPLLHVQRGLPLAQAGLLAAAPTFGMVLTLVAWGALADRFGERWVIAAGLGLTALFTVCALLSPGYVSLAVFLVLGGASAASTNAASGRVVVGWFPKRRRGVAMGIRQMSQPLGVTIAALAIPTLASGHGIAGALALPLGLNLVLAVLCAILLVDPPRPAASRHPGAAAENPYRASSFLWRIHAVSILLVLPQFTLSTFGLVWLISGFGWKEAIAGLVIAGSQFLGALGRIAIGSLSDRFDSRVGLLRWVGTAGTAAMGLLALLSATPWGAVAAVGFVVATIISVADNGLAFTSVAEAAGHRWSGKALGVQNTGQFVAASAVGPGIGALIAGVGFPLAFALVALAPLLSIPVVPRRDRAAD